MLTEKLIKEYGTAKTKTRLQSWEGLLFDIINRSSLTTDQYKKIEKHYEAVGDVIKMSTNALLKDAQLYSQGSFMTRTVVVSTTEDPVDVDAIAWLPHASSSPAMTVFDAVHRELHERTKTQGGVKPKNRCVRVNYADQNPKFHMDVTPAINAPGNFQEDGSGALRVPDREIKDYKSSNPKGFAAWLDNTSKLKVTLVEFARVRILAKAEGVEPLPSHGELTGFDPLRAAIKLMKLHRDNYFQDADKKTKPISVLITTLAGKAYSRVVQESKATALTPLQALLRIVELMSECLDAPSATQKWVLKNPVDQGENFAEKWNWNQALADAFFAWNAQLRRDVQLGLVNFPAQAEFEEAVTAAFGRGTSIAVKEHIKTAVKAGLEVAGLSEAAVRKARGESATAALFGNKITQPEAQQSIKPLGRLG